MANDLPSSAGLAEEKDQSFLLIELIKELAQIHRLLSFRLQHPLEHARE